ncbi:unnamed protein product [Symbiodinium microadriaticum]|nr:unnamed protein product [Symbiodinium microadriaticum]
MTCLIVSIVIAGSVEVATVNRTAQKSDQVAYASSQIISSATMEIITVLGIAVVTMGILLSVITVQNRPSNRAAIEEARQVAVVQRLSAQEAYSSDLQRVEHRELTQSELDRISRL